MKVLALRKKEKKKSVSFEAWPRICRSSQICQTLVHNYDLSNSEAPSHSFSIVRIFEFTPTNNQAKSDWTEINKPMNAPEWNMVVAASCSKVDQRPVNVGQRLILSVRELKKLNFKIYLGCYEIKIRLAP